MRRKTQNNTIMVATQPTVEETPDELKARLREAHRQAIAGEIYSQEEAHDLMREYVKQRLLHSA